MTNDELAAELERLNEKATPGPWGTVYGAGGWAEGFMIDTPPYKEANVHLTLAYRNHHAAIVSALRDVAKMREALEPFAKAADIKLCGEWADDQQFAPTDVGSYLTFGHLRDRPFRPGASTMSARDVIEATARQWGSRSVSAGDVATDILAALSAAGYVIVPREQVAQTWGKPATMKCYACGKVIEAAPGQGINAKMTSSGFLHVWCDPPTALEQKK